MQFSITGMWILVRLYRIPASRRRARMTRPEWQVPIRCSTVKRWNARLDAVAPCMLLLVVLLGLPMIIIFPQLLSPDFSGFAVFLMALGSGFMWILCVSYIMVVVILKLIDIAHLLTDHIPRLTCIKDDEREAP
jgi:hypothetical protein